MQKERYEIIIWSSPIKLPVEQQTYVVLKVWECLANFSEETKFRFLTKAFKEHPNMEFIPEFQFVRDILLANRNREGKRIFEDLGSSIDLFNDSGGFSLSIGISEPRFINTLVVQLNTGWPENKAFHDILQLFCDLCEILKPRWGCVTSSLNYKRFTQQAEAIDQSKVPEAIYWINCFGDQILQNIPEDRLRSCVLDDQIRKIDAERLVFYLTSEIFSDSNPDHIRMQNSVQECIQLKELHRKCPYH